jgi:hypothetical protein
LLRPRKPYHRLHAIDWQCESNMNDRVTLRPAVPPTRELEDFSGRVTQIRAPATAQLELRNQVPNLGPYRMGESTYYNLQVYPGPLLKVVSGPAQGARLDTSA